jgi:hypothetical protein
MKLNSAESSFFNHSYEVDGRVINTCPGIFYKKWISFFCGGFDSINFGYRHILATDFLFYLNAPPWPLMPALPPLGAGAHANHRYT